MENKKNAKEFLRKNWFHLVPFDKVSEDDFVDVMMDYERKVIGEVYLELCALVATWQGYDYHRTDDIINDMKNYINELYPPQS